MRASTLMKRLRVVVEETKIAEGRRDGADVHVEKPVFEVERLFDAGQLQARAVSFHFIVHRAKRLIVVSGLLGSLRP